MISTRRINHSHRTMRIGYLDEATFSEQAARAHFSLLRKGAEFSSAGKTLGDVFDAVLSGRFDSVAIPLRNSSATDIKEVYEILADPGVYPKINVGAKIKIVGEELVMVEQCLIAPEGTMLKDINTVYSKQEALAQCKKFIEEHGFGTVAENSTAAGADRILAEKLKNAELRV